MILRFCTDRSEHAVHTQIKEQSDQSLHYLPFCLYLGRYSHIVQVLE